MTVGNLFLLIMLLVVTLLGIAYIIYKSELRRLKKLGYRNPSEYTDFSYYILMTYLTGASIFAFGFLLYKIIVNWNMSI